MTAGRRVWGGRISKKINNRQVGEMIGGGEKYVFVDDQDAEDEIVSFFASRRRHTRCREVS